mmetsp:Transcript_74677/g.178151  ORF Transcript_74677/g.178151 Transcript_74677/m.178151 type:complete len:216 (-) Transcript_74677:189-836(-)
MWYHIALAGDVINTLKGVCSVGFGCGSLSGGRRAEHLIGGNQYGLNARTCCGRFGASGRFLHNFSMGQDLADLAPKPLREPLRARLRVANRFHLWSSACADERLRAWRKPEPLQARCLEAKSRCEPGDVRFAGPAVGAEKVIILLILLGAPATDLLCLATCLRQPGSGHIPGTGTAEAGNPDGTPTPRPGRMTEVFLPRGHSTDNVWAKGCHKEL